MENRLEYLNAEKAYAYHLPTGNLTTPFRQASYLLLLLKDLYRKNIR